MSVLNEIDLGKAEYGNAEIIRGNIAREFWNWYEEHREDKIISIGFLFIRKTLRVKDIRFVFVMLFGDPPPLEV